MTPTEKLTAFLHTPHFHVVPFAMEHWGTFLAGICVGVYLAVGFLVGFAYSNDGSCYGADLRSWILRGTAWPYTLWRRK